MPGSQKDSKGGQKSPNPKSEGEKDGKERQKTTKRKSDGEQDPQKFTSPRPGSDLKQTLKPGSDVKQTPRPGSDVKKTPRPGSDVKQTEKKKVTKKDDGDTKIPRDVVDRNTTKLFEAVKRGQTHNMEEFIRLGADVNGRDEDGKTPIIRAAELRNNTVQALLMAKNVDVNASDKLNRTALHFEAAQGDTESVKQLLAYGSNIDVKDVEGRTPLHFAVNRNHVSTADILVFCGADGKIKDKSRVTPESVCETPEMWKLMQRSREITYAIKQEYITIHRTALRENTTIDLSSIGLRVQTPKGFSKSGVCFLCRRVRPEYSHSSLGPKNKELLISDTFEFRMSGSQYKGKVKVHIPMYTKPEPYEEVHIKTSKKPRLREDSEEIVTFEREETTNQWICSVDIDLKEINSFVLVTRPRVEHFKVGSKGGVFVSEVDDFIKLDIPEKSFSDKGDLTLELIPRPAYTNEELKNQKVIETIEITSVSNFYEVNHTNKEQPQNDVTVTLPLPRDYRKDNTDLYIVSRRNQEQDESELSLWEIVCVNPKQTAQKTTFKASHFSSLAEFELTAMEKDKEFRDDLSPSADVGGSEEQVKEYDTQISDRGTTFQNGDLSEDHDTNIDLKEEHPVETKTQDENDPCKPQQENLKEEKRIGSSVSVKKETEGSNVSLQIVDKGADSKSMQGNGKPTDQKNTEVEGIKDVPGADETESKHGYDKDTQNADDRQSRGKGSKVSISSRASSRTSVNKEGKTTKAKAEEDGDPFYDDEEDEAGVKPNGEDNSKSGPVEADTDMKRKMERADGKSSSSLTSTVSLKVDDKDNLSIKHDQSEETEKGIKDDESIIAETQSMKDNISRKSHHGSQRSLNGSHKSLQSNKSNISDRNRSKGQSQRLDHHPVPSLRGSSTSTPRSSRKDDSISDTSSIRKSGQRQNKVDRALQRTRETEIKKAAAMLYEKARKRKCKVSFVVMLNITDDYTYETLAECTMKDPEKRLPFWKTEGFEDQKPSFPKNNEYDVIPKTVFNFNITGAAECIVMQKLEFHPKRKDENFIRFAIERTTDEQSEAIVDILMKDGKPDKSENESLGTVILHLDGVNSQKKRSLQNAKKDQNFKGFTHDSFLEQIAKKLSDEWYKLGIHLGLAKSVLDKADSVKEDKKLKMLITWRDNCRYRIDLGVRHLTVALRRVERNDIEEFVIKKLDEWLEKHKKNEDAFCTWLHTARSERWEVPKGSLVPLSDAFLMTLVDHVGKNLPLIHRLDLPSAQINNVEEDTRFFRIPERQMLELLVQAKRRSDSNIGFFKELDIQLGNLGLTEAQGWYRNTTLEWCSQQTDIDGDSLVEQLKSYLEEVGYDGSIPEGATGGQ